MLENNGNFVNREEESVLLSAIQFKVEVAPSTLPSDEATQRAASLFAQVNSRNGVSKCLAIWPESPPDPVAIEGAMHPISLEC
jgi:hypothetical protein